MASLSRQFARKRPSGGDSASSAASNERRSLKSLASMDVGELVQLVRMPRLPRPKLGGGPGGSGRPSRSGQRPVVGVDLEPGFLAAAQVSVNGGISIERAAGVALSPDVIRDGEVIDAVALSSALHDLFAEHKLDRNVRLGIANQRIVVRMLELPPMTNPAELDAAVRFQAQDELPMSIDSAVLDYEALGVYETPSGPRQRVVLVAARREMIERLVSVAQEAGLRPVGVDLSAFALIRSLYAPASHDDERVAYLSVGGLGNLAVAQGHTCSFTRVLSVGLESIAGDLAERLGVAVTDARELVMRTSLADETAPSFADIAPLPAVETESTGGVDLTTSGELDVPPPEGAYLVPLGGVDPQQLAAHDAAPTELSGRDPSPAPMEREPVVAPSSDAGEAVAVSRDVLADGVRRIAVEVRNSLHYHAMHGAGESMTRLVVTGAMTDIPGFVEMLDHELDLEVQPFRVHEARPGALSGVSGARIAVAAGLAVSEVSP